MNMMQACLSVCQWLWWWWLWWWWWSSSIVFIIMIIWICRGQDRDYLEPDDDCDRDYEDEDNGDDNLEGLDHDADNNYDDDDGVQDTYCCCFDGFTIMTMRKIWTMVTHLILIDHQRRWTYKYQQLRSVLLIGVLFLVKMKMVRTDRSLETMIV